MTNDVKTRKKRDTTQKHQAILAGATKVFIEFGFTESSMDMIAEVAGVSKRTIYNHFNSKEVLFQAILADFLKQREAIKPIKYSPKISLGDQLKEFARAELFLIDDPIRRGLSKLFTSVFLMDVEFGKATRSQYNPHKALIVWLNSAKEDRKLYFQSPELPARIFYGMVEGCLTYPALFTDGASLKNVDLLLDEIIDTFLCRFGSKIPG